MKGYLWALEIKYFSGFWVVLSNLELALYPMANPVMSVLVKYMDLWSELWDFAVELACGRKLPDAAVEGDVFSWNWRIYHRVYHLLASTCVQLLLPSQSSCCFLRTVVPCCHQWKHFALPLLWGPAQGALSILGPVLVRPLLHQAHVNMSVSFHVCYALGRRWWASHNHLLLSEWFGHVTFCPRVIQNCCMLFPLLLKCHHENCHPLSLKCYD